ncbi:MarR family winged helix-turn-helix transcriptional regulator [Thermophilibacter immobilis]|jgi:DNA-binding MarR family transcriptional regulator|uniref:MarR family transcriptional regulator n=1 Tax=Thermophilibacter immobilis TaxID=2779519 RepID=A0A7S7M8C8_9ACTN|nr:MarR family transcriptional regulator [Thermophilibacter immobilis]QOY60640.1 MarR family transcriptional regulator [Thermophilibacter immobilis]
MPATSPCNLTRAADEEDPYASLRLDNQLCFPLYAAAKEVVRRYKPLLTALDLTYTQYIAMMVMWELGETNVSELGARLYLDSGTLTPLLRKLEEKGYVRRQRGEKDGRELRVSLTEEGLALRDRALSVPRELAGYIELPRQDLIELRRILRAFLDTIGDERKDTAS